MANSFLAGVTGDGQFATHRQFNQVWSADGINDYLSFENSAAVQDLLLNRLGQNNRFTISCWVNPLTNIGSQYLFLNIVNGNNALSSGHWNIQTPISIFTLLYGGISTNSGTQGWQILRSGVFRNDFASLTSANFTNRLCHFAWVNSGSGSNRFRIYVNGRLWSKSETLFLFTNYNQTNTFSFIALCTYSFNNAAFVFIPLRLTDFMICTVAATDGEIRQIYNNGTNITANYASRYPTNLLNNRWVHLPLSDGNFTVTGTNLFANDISGNNRNFRVFGQATTPTLVSAY